MVKSPNLPFFEDWNWNSLKSEHVINDVEVRTRVFCSMAQTEKGAMDSDDSQSYSSSPSCESANKIALADCAGTQQYLFKNYDSEASSGTSSNESSKEETFECLQNTDW